MKIALISVGNMREAPLRELYERYAARIPHYMPFEALVIPDLKTTRGLTAEMQKQREGEAIMAKIAPGDYVVLMDERGREMTSRVCNRWPLWFLGARLRARRHEDGPVKAHFHARNGPGAHRRADIPRNDYPAR